MPYGEACGMKRYDITDGETPGEGERVGFAQPLPTGLIHIRIDGYLTPKAAQFACIQILAAINDATPQGPPR
jgi:hypothetical protein